MYVQVYIWLSFYSPIEYLQEKYKASRKKQIPKITLLGVH